MDQLLTFAIHAAFYAVFGVALVRFARRPDRLNRDVLVVFAAIAGLFEAPHGDRIDVVALACTHFPLLAGELAAAAPRAVTWLDSGAAIAARLKAVAGLAEGQARLRRAGFTGTVDPALWTAFAARGFTARAVIGGDFSVAPAPGEGYA